MGVKAFRDTFQGIHLANVNMTFVPVAEHFGLEFLQSLTNLPGAADN
jgi:hypothetical protein